MLRALFPAAVPLVALYALAACPGVAHAQNSNQSAPQSASSRDSLLSVKEQTSLPGDQKIERLQWQDGGNRIEELRVGGESQEILVQPRAPVPAYQVLRNSPQRGNGVNASDAAGRPRVWNILNF